MEPVIDVQGYTNTTIAGCHRGVIVHVLFVPDRGFWGYLFYDLKRLRIWILRIFYNKVRRKKK